MQGLQFITDALNNDNADVRAAACICLRNVSRSVKVCCFLLSTLCH